MPVALLEGMKTSHQSEAIEIASTEMTTIAHDARLVDAYTKMRLAKIRHLPVVDASRKIVGMLSDRDLQRAMIPVGVAGQATPGFEFDPAHRVDDFMSWPVRSVSGHTEIRQVARLMLDEKISALIVTGADRRAAGILTTDDLLRLLVSLLAAEPEKARKPLDWLLQELRVPNSALI